MTSNPYDPKLLEAWFRFMAEATRSGSGASEAFQQASSGGAPPNFAEMMTRFYSPTNLPANLAGQPETFNAMTEAWLASFGMVPKSRYDALETQYEALLEKFRDSERTAQTLRASAMGTEQTQEVLKTWEGTVQKTLQAQTAWWGAWTGVNASATDREVEEQGEQNKDETPRNE